MADITKELLSGSVDGLPIVVNQTALGSAVTVHTASAVAGVKDELWVWADNDSSNDVLLTLCLGGVTDVTHTIKATIPAKGKGANQDGLVCVIPGLPLANGKILKAIAASQPYIKLTGFVNRITN